MKKYFFIAVNFFYDFKSISKIYIFEPTFCVMIIFIFFHDIHGLHKAISKILIFKKGLLEGSEIKFIRTMLDLSQQKLSSLIGCNYQQILLWEKNKNKISKPADRLLRIIFFTYLNKEIDNGKVFERINEIADLDAMKADPHNKIEFKEVKDTWQLVA